MLNNRKNNFVRKDIVLSKPSFLQYPKLSKDNFVQSTQVRQLKLGFNTVFSQKISKSAHVNNVTRFEYNSKQFREFFIFNSLVKKPTIKFNSNNLKQFLFFLNCILKERKKVKPC